MDADQSIVRGQGDTIETNHDEENVLNNKESAEKDSIVSTNEENTALKECANVSEIVNLKCKVAAKDTDPEVLF